MRLIITRADRAARRRFRGQRPANPRPPQAERSQDQVSLVPWRRLGRARPPRFGPASRRGPGLRSARSTRRLACGAASTRRACRHCRSVVVPWCVRKPKGALPPSVTRGAVAPIGRPPLENQVCAKRQQIAKTLHGDETAIITPQKSAFFRSARPRRPICRSQKPIAGADEAIAPRREIHGFLQSADDGRGVCKVNCAAA